MIEFRLNLIRDRVPSAQTRRRHYWLMIGYLAVSGVLLAITTGMATQRLLAAAHLRTERAQLEAGFRNEHPTGDSIQEFYRDILDQLGRQKGMLQAVDARLRGDLRFAAMLRSLAQSLPSGVSLRSISVNPENKSIQVELLSMNADGERASSPSDLLARWNQDAAIASQVREWTYKGSQSEGGQGRNDRVMRFDGQLQRRDG